MISTNKMATYVDEEPLEIPGWKRWLYKNERGLLGLFGIVVVLVLWEILGRSGAIDPVFTSAPSLILVAGINYFTEGNALLDLKVSGSEFLVGFLLSIVIGIPFGIMMGWYDKINAFLDPLVNFLYSAPRIALMPVFIIWFGIDMTSKVAIIFLGSIFPIIINTIVGIRTIDPVLLNVARSHMANDFQIFRTIVLPSTVPAVISGIRLGLGHALIGIVVGEMVAATAGLGYTMHQAGASFQTDLVFFILILISGCGVLCTELLRRLERKFDKWRPELHK
ncbi:MULTISPECIES: ABC transporter permease [unclassified Paenibacillus]|uniref:ABC transporter permease n=1 Tax=unclassified Paenibacillus TaxID=185978 RepID=UPI001AE7F258|nr:MULTISPECIES: ABC transporter permease [unclassified Paenibacillus]MBP1154150.1 NitT/TauT family transport system permease protein [Paenibacillus sp. PvP091]MBP1170465.1 NitT/TauT family transport system permease protein [Paenibacillus sp. PvR098]MBP2441493.1 NitT/TauT family transport system permease protein [Paenibacillus sp. PvP052]